MLDEGDDRSIEATPSRRGRAVDAGAGPRAPWLASAASGLVALGLLSVAAGPVAVGAGEWLKGSLGVAASEPEADLRLALTPALAASVVVGLAVVVGNALAHGGWIRFGAWRRGGRTPLASRIRAVVAGWSLGGVALAGGIAGALPWVASIPTLLARPVADAAWAAMAFAASCALGALLAMLVMGMIQLRLALRAFDRMLRMTRTEARDEERSSRGRVRRGPAGWRLA